MPTKRPKLYYALHFALGVIAFTALAFPPISTPNISQRSPAPAPSQSPTLTEPPGQRAPAQAARPTNLTAGSLNRSTHSSPPTSTAPTASDKIVRFDSITARDAFLSQNNLATEQLVWLPKLNAYRVQVPNLAPTPGSRFFDNHTYRMTLTPTDSLYSSQSYLSRINASTAWNHQTGSANVRLAIIDSGFGLNHQELIDHWARNTGETGATANEGPIPNCTSRGLALDKACNNLDDDNNTLIDDSLGYDFTNFTASVQAGETNPQGDGVSHGTMTAGVISATGNNARGTTGVMWQSSLIPIQALDDDGNGSTISVAYAIRYAVDQGAQVINLSLGSNSNDPLVAEQVSYALAHNVNVIAAAGNDGCDCILYPARYSGVISVGALNTSSTRTSFSSYGARLELTAPGTDICSPGWQPGNETSAYACGLAGTSFSSPLTAGTIGLMLAQNPSLTPTQVHTALTGSATKLSAMNGANWTSSYGYGQLNALGALSAISLPTPTGQPINTHLVQVSQPNSGYTAHLYDSLNSSCVSTTTDAVCRIRAINATTNAIINLSSNETTDGLTNLYWQTTGMGLSSGSWLIQSYALVGGVQSLAREETLIVSP
ncbi:MAG: S8 family serine peptidase [Candidatus Saccharibacteria bacterium]